MYDVAVKLPLEKRAVLVAAVKALQNASNVVALVLGGSYARGVAQEGSDLDIGIYYGEAAPLSVQEVRIIAESICTPGSLPVVTELYGWGPWVNGGAWIQTPATKVDFVYRNLDQVRGVIEEGQLGVWRHDYEQQPPYGFRSIVYFAETHFCLPLHDPEGEIRALKSAVATYPEVLKTRIVHDSLWGAEFSIWSCDRFASSADVYNAAGCMTRAAQYLVHAIFALNEEYFLNDKYVNGILAQLPKSPHDCAARLADVLSRAGRDAAELRNSLEALRQLWADTVKLTDGAYQPRFDLTAALAPNSTSAHGHHQSVG
jgi:hypothetical protein